MLSPVLIGAIIQVGLVVLLGVGFTFTYMVEKVPNFAHAGLATVGTVITWHFVRVYDLNPYETWPISTFLGGLMGIALYLLVVRPIRFTVARDITFTFAFFVITHLISPLVSMYSYWFNDLFFPTAGLSGRAPAPTRPSTWSWPRRCEGECCRRDLDTQNWRIDTMDMMEAMKQSEAVEIALRNGHVVYGRFLGVSDGNYLLCDPDGALVFVPTGADNLAYVKVVSPDPEISRVMDRLFGARPSRRPVAEPEAVGSGQKQPLAESEPQSPRRVDVQPIILAGPPSNRQAAIEAVKEKFRHNTSFASPAVRPAFRPRIESEDGEE